MNVSKERKNNEEVGQSLGMAITKTKGSTPKPYM